MNSRIIKNGLKQTLKKSLINLSVCLVTVVTLASCASTNSREIAQQKVHDYSLKNDVEKIESNQAPHRFHSNRFEKYDQY